MYTRTDPRGAPQTITDTHAVYQVHHRHTRRPPRGHPTYRVGSQIALLDPAKIPFNDIRTCTGSTQKMDTWRGSGAARAYCSPAGVGWRMAFRGHPVHRRRTTRQNPPCNGLGWWVKGCMSSSNTYGEVDTNLPVHMQFSNKSGLQ